MKNNEAVFACEAYYVDIPDVRSAANTAKSDKKMSAYLVRPKGEGIFPGVVVGFELFGLTAYVRRMAEQIASLGYVVIVPDFYHRTAPGIELNADDAGRKHGFELLHQLTRHQALEDVASAIAFLQENEKVTLPVAMVGFSVGGHIAYLAAANLDIKLAVVFYPGWLPVTFIPLSQPEPTLSLTPQLAEREHSILLLIGEEDALIPQDQRQLISDALEANHVDYEMVVYPQAPHGFFCDERSSYHAASAQDAWQRVKTALTKHLYNAE